MQMAGRDDHSARLHRRAEHIEAVQAEARLEDAMAAAEGRAPDGSPRRGGRATSPHRSVGLSSLSTLADLHHARGNYTEAVRLQRRILAEEEAAYGRDSHKLLPRLHALAQVLADAGERHEALCIRQRIANMTGLEHA